MKPGDVLAGKYVLGECIGAGGMGAVFLAEHPELARPVAIKVLHPHLAADEALADRFWDEILAASRVQHRGSVAVVDYDVGATGTPFMVMELVRGRPLGLILGEQELPFRRVIGILDQILDALGAAHACSVVHADVKSDNFLVDVQPGGDVVTMVDFGLAQLDGAVVEPGFVAGTPEYIAPELIRGEPPSPASDLYGVGVILYEMLTGVTPFAGGSTNQILQRHLDALVVSPSTRRPDRRIPQALERIALRALAKDPDDRFATAGELRAALAGVALEREEPAPGRRFSARACAGVTQDHACIAPLERPRFARGSDAGGGGRDDLLRHAIESAVVRGDVWEIAGAYTKLASALIGECRLGAAICELEEGLDVLAEVADPGRPEARESFDQMVASLAAAYELAGEPVKARRTLARADARQTFVDLTAGPRG